MAKPLEERKYLAYLRLVGWSLEKSGFDYNLCNEKGNFVCTIKIMHGKQKKREISAASIRKTEIKFEERGLLWPPKKKSKNI
jgi:hypothetical protein